MAIWSLTKERVDKLQKQIGDREMEIDELIKLSKEDLWKKDLEDFINEWRVQLAEEHTRQKKVANLGRRASTKLKLAAKGPEARKRKAQGDDPSDSDFGVAKSKKPAVAKHVQPKAGMLAYLSASANPKPAVTATKALTNGAKPVAKPLEDVKPAKVEKSEDVWMQIDGAASSSSDVPVAPMLQKAKVTAPATKKSAPAKKKKVISDDDSDDEVISKPAVPSRKPRAAATKPVKYDVLSNSDSDDVNFDIGNMVKSIGDTSINPATAAAAAAAGSRPLFSARASISRPGSSAGLTKSTTKSTSKGLIDLDDDETDYSKLAPVGIRTASRVTAKGTVLSDDDDMDDSFDIAPPPPPPPAKVAKAPASKAAAAAAAKPVAKAKPAPKKETAKKPVAVAVAAPKKKLLPLSPAAKAYAAKQAKNRKKVVESSEEEEDGDDEGDVHVHVDMGRGGDGDGDGDGDVDVGRDEVEDMANEILGDEDGDEDEDEDVPMARGRARPARRAAVNTKVKNWVVDDDDDDDDDDDSSEEDEGSEEESEGFEDADSE